MDWIGDPNAWLGLLTLTGRAWVVNAAGTARLAEALAQERVEVAQHNLSPALQAL